MEKLFIGFWVWHTVEWLISFISHRRREKKYSEYRDAEFQCMKDQADYWHRENLKSEITFELYKIKNAEEINKIPLGNIKP